jgi:hypothetical protein
MANSFPRISAKTDRLDTELRERGFWGVAAWKTGATAQSHGGGRGDGHNPSHANMARCQRCELRVTLSFLGQYAREPGQTASSMPTDTTLQNAIASAWHS